VPGKESRAGHARRDDPRERRVRPLRVHRQRVPAPHGPQPGRLPGLRRQGQACAWLDIRAHRRARSPAGCADLLARRPLPVRGPLRLALGPPGISGDDPVRLRPMRTRAKICGITRVEDAQAAATHGADAIGLIFYRPSPRYVTPEQARRIVEAAPAFVTTVAVFVNPTREEV